MTAAQFDGGAEFDRQVRTLVGKGYPGEAGLTWESFVRLVTPLRETVLARGGSMLPPTAARVPFVLVVSTDTVSAHSLMRLTELDGRAGFADFEADDIGRFAPIKEVSVPAGPAYLVFDIDRGADTLGVTPDAALTAISGRGRTPLTVGEGIAFITQFPGSLQKNNCFSLVASRCGDRRVPALWISKRAPKLGWCWAGNPHTWLGSASCADRAGLA